MTVALSGEYAKPEEVQVRKPNEKQGHFIDKMWTIVVLSGLELLYTHIYIYPYFFGFRFFNVNCHFQLCSMQQPSSIWVSK